MYFVVDHVATNMSADSKMLREAIKSKCHDEDRLLKKQQEQD